VDSAPRPIVFTGIAAEYPYRRARGLRGAAGAGRWNGNLRRELFPIVAVIVFLLAAGCARHEESAPVEIHHFPLDTMAGLVTQSGVAIDTLNSSDGNGSLKITASEPTVARLFEIGGIDIENAKLIYRARIRSEDIAGKAYLEMWLRFPGKGEYFSRGLDRPLTGTTAWTTEEIPFFLKKGEIPDLIRLNIAIEGTGTVWIDDIRLFKAAP